ncbi:MAG TPA: fused response regulator/phosphatase [Thermoanaerobaculia bacterium]|nr:fused response regulator/phosphatase [Thermoanaerobaculia bacterium]
MSQERILVIDDNAADARLISRVLERHGYDVNAAFSGEEGLIRARERAPDCVLVDYRMPGMDGYEVCRRLKTDPALQSVPVLMLTGADSTRNLVEGLEAGADDFVTKSAELEVILARMRALLRIKAYQDRIVEQSTQLRTLYEEVKQKSDKILALNQRMNKDLQFARKVQESLLPARVFRAPGLEIRSAYIPSETLSGDFYDYFEAGRDRLLVFVADVSGHGLPSAILVSLLKSYLHSDATQSESLSSFMANLNNFLCTASLPSQFATAQLFRYDPSRRTLDYCSAAHPPFLLFRRSEGKASVVENPGHLLGALPQVEYEEFHLQVEPGDLLFAYTDGLTDLRNMQGDFYPIERVCEILERSGDDLDTLHQKILEDATQYAMSEETKDDIAVLLGRFS